MGFLWFGAQISKNIGDLACRNSCHCDKKLVMED